MGMGKLNVVEYPVGDRRYLVDGNYDFQVFGPLDYFVNKLTGEVRAGSLQAIPSSSSRRSWME
jgi:hypothetical protein